MLNYPFSTYDPTFDTFGTLTLTEGQASPTEPLSLVEVKAHLRVEHDADDDLIGALITAARSQAELMQRRVLVRKQFDLSYDYWPGYRIELGSPTVSVDLVQYTDSDGVVHTLAKDTDYLVDLRKQPAVITTQIYQCWPSFTPQTSSSILIRYTAGYEPDDLFWAHAGSRLKAGMLLLISNWYTNRIPFSPTAAVSEFPFAVTACLSAGSLRRPR